MREKQVEEFPSIIEDKAKSHGEKFYCRPPTPTNSLHRRLGPTRWDDSFEMSEHQKSPAILISPNSVMSLNTLVSPRRRKSLIAVSSGGQLDAHGTMKPQTSAAAFIASLPLDDHTDACQ